MNTFPFECTRCEKEDPATFAHLRDTDNWLRFYPEEKTLHIHFGRSTHTQIESDLEAEWLESTVQSGLAANPTIIFFVLIDLSRADDSEFPSEKSREVYRTLLSHPQMKKTVFFGVTPAMGFLIKTLVHLSKRQQDIFVVTNITAAVEKIEELKKAHE